jgi:hypothetical protein
MAITSTVEKSKNLTIYILTGELTLDEILNALQSFWEAHTLTLNLLWDARSAKMSQLKSEEAAKITGFIGQYKHLFEERIGGKAAIVASSNLQYGLSRILGTFYEMEGFPTQLKIFRIMNEAIKWLDQDE